MRDAAVIALFVLARFSPLAVLFSASVYAGMIPNAALLAAFFAAVFLSRFSAPRRDAIHPFFMGICCSRKIPRLAAAHVAWGLAAALALLALNALVRLVADAAAGAGEAAGTDAIPPAVRDMLRSSPFAAAAVFLALAALTEEIFFRSYLLARFRAAGLKPAAAILLSALLFALPHAAGFLGGDAAQWKNAAVAVAFAFAAGILLALLMTARKSLLAVATAHIAYNTAIVAFARFM